MSIPTPSHTRGGWIFLAYGIAAVVFGLATLVWPGATILAMVLAFGILSIAEGIASLISMMGKQVALPSWLLLLYAVISIGFGILAVMQPAQMATAMLWFVAAWLLVGGVARLIFAFQVRKLVEGEWLLALSGVLAIALGLLFLLRPGAGLIAVALWIAAGALVYGVLQVVVGVRLLRLGRSEEPSGHGSTRAM